MRVHRGAAIATLVLAVGLAGCASKTATLDVGYPEAGVNPALLASVTSRRLEITSVGDRRLDGSRIGSTPKNGKDLVTKRAVSDVIRDALVVELRRNGHVVVADQGDFALAADVEEFWLDTVVGYSTTQHVGKVAIALAVVDRQTGDRVLTRRYVGIKRQQAEKPSESAGREAMDAALARTMRDLATDLGLVAALARLPTADRARWP